MSEADRLVSEYMQLKADIMCDHGIKIKYTYGEFGQLPTMLAELARQEE